MGTAQESWWQRFARLVPDLAKLGVTQVWLPPPNKASEKLGRGYDAYDLWDLGEFSQKGTIATRWGTKAQLLNAIHIAKGHGVQVLVDAVLNHKVGADGAEHVEAIPVHPLNRTIEVAPKKTIKAWTVFDFPGRNGKYSPFRWKHEHFTGVDWDGKARDKGVFKITSNRKRGWSQFVSKELGNYDYLLGADVDHLHPEVRADMLAWASWVLGETGAQGFRLDACKHFDHRFLCEFVKTARSAGRPQMFAVAEVWNSEVGILLDFMNALSVPMALFDAPLHTTFHKASMLGPDFDLRTIFHDSLVQSRPRDAVTFVENHDTVEGQSLESPVSRAFAPIAYSIILLRPEGYPCVYHADLMGPRAIPELPKLMEARKRFAYGRCIDHIENSRDPNFIGFLRTGKSKDGPGCAVILSNDVAITDSSKVLTISVGTQHTGTRWCDYLGREGETYIDADGKGHFPILYGTCVYVREDTM
ncbi:glycoside hydrolase family 13 protein [Cantharellus anzutake]|uniref:glycoside hydrolase family 13 protein n=1 Tax=Cantharellus anzutake TaxID=1750568 RepID=UPI001904CB23|nr:glycoside hydrolase family 13 protein [Cantharellus anzutake]KAF8328149.1 glycoside hydrolase family 13 protein [Cantharellus anzutake]